MSGARKLTLEHVVIAAAVAVGMAATAGPINDNSMLLHIRTGIDMVRDWNVPSVDPYSFTARGQEWVVQSWLALVSYGLLHRLGGYGAIIIEQMVLSGLLAFLMVLLARTGSMTRTTLAIAIPMSLGFAGWVTRPLLFGLVCFALVVFVVERRRSLWWLLPIGWVWANTHGSFPLGIVWLGAIAVGSSIDQRKVDVALACYLGAFVGGLLLGAINPVGPKILLFFTRAMGERGENFAYIEEWQSPDFHNAYGLFLVAALVGALLILFRDKVTWRHALPVAAFVGATLYAERNITGLAIVLCPVLGALLTPTAVTNAVDTSKRVVVAALACILLLVGAMSGRALASEPFNFEMYPVAGVQWLRDQGLLTPEHRLASREITGCYLIFQDGRNANIFIDDRIDMYPSQITEDFLHLLTGDADPQPILDRHRIDLVLWEKEMALTQTLTVDQRWEQRWNDEDWVIFQRKGGTDAPRLPR